MAAFTDLQNPSRKASNAVQEIRNIFCVGRNYHDHAVELGNDVPTKPMIFGKSTHALVMAEGKLNLPPQRQNIHHELEIVLYIEDTYTPGKKVQDLVSTLALGLDLTDRDAQNDLKKAGHPWEYAKGFPGSAVLTDFYQIENWEDLQNIEFALKINGQSVQSGSPQQMIFPFQELIDFVGTNFGLSRGDILFTGTPAGVGALLQGQHLEFFLAGQTIGQCLVETL